MTLYTDCSLPFPLFVKGTVGRDMTVVIIEGEIETAEDAERVSQAWLSVNSEYTELIEDPGMRELSRNQYRLAEIGAKILRVKLLVESARVFPFEEYLVALQEEGYRVDLSSRESLDRSFESILTGLKADEIDYDQLNAKINAGPEGEEEEEKPPVTEADFDRMLMLINRNEKLPYRAADLTTRLFAILFAEFRKSQRPTLNET